MKTHELKILPVFFEPVKTGKKSFEVRKNDRDYEVGDEVVLKEYTSQNGFSGRLVKAKITYILDDKDFCKNGFVIFGIALQD